MLIKILFIVVVIGVYLLAGQLFNRRLGLLTVLLMFTSYWGKTIIMKNQIKIFLATVIIIYGLWVVFKTRPKLAVSFVLFSFLLMTLTLYPNISFWLKHGFCFDPTFVPIIHDYISRCHQKLPLVVCRLVYNKPTFFAQNYLVNYFGHFSPDSLFMDPGKEFLLLAPFFYWGLFKILVDWRKWLVLTIWIILYPLAASYTGGFDYFHSAFGLVLMPLITAWGIYLFFRLFINQR